MVRTVTTIVKMKSLTKVDIKNYLSSGEWMGKAGGYAIQGKAAIFIPFISGSYTNIVGLPLTETVNLLVGNGFQLNEHTLTN
jgi:septum formation protein